MYIYIYMYGCITREGLLREADSTPGGAHAESETDGWRQSCE